MHVAVHLRGPIRYLFERARAREREREREREKRACNYRCNWNIKTTACYSISMDG
jgi:hypothetical protein